MENEILFSEKQKFNQFFILLILVGINGLMLYGIFQQVILGKPFGDRPIHDVGLFVISGVIMVFTFFMLSLRLETNIQKDGIYLCFFPIQKNFKKHAWEDISKAYIRKYNPLLEYGGWGLRYGFFGKGKAYNVSGNKGLQLEFKNGKKLLIGTNKADALKETLKNMQLECFTE